MKQRYTPEEVAQRLHVSRRTVLTLEIPKIRIGHGRGKIVYNEDDIEAYIKARTEYPLAKGEQNANRVQKRPKKMGLSVLPSRADLEAIRLEYAGGSEKRGGSASHRVA